MNKLHKAIRHTKILARHTNKLAQNPKNSEYLKNMYAKDTERLAFVLKLLEDLRKAI